jgi:hypothetical protein
MWAFLLISLMMLSSTMIIHLETSEGIYIGLGADIDET